MVIGHDLTTKNILFIHNTIMWYRMPFFKKLSQIYDFKLVLTHIHISKEIYNVEISDKDNNLENVNVKVLKNYFGIAFGIIKEAFQDYDIMVGGSWDTISETIETILYFTIAKLRRKKFILWREDWAWKSKSFKKSLIMPLIKVIVKNSDAIVVPGIKHKEYFISLGSYPEKVFLMPNVSNITLKTEDFKKSDEIKRKLHITDEKVVLYVGRLVKRKGVDYLINAFAKLNKKLNKTVLIVVGTGESKDELKLLSKNLKLENDIHFIGQIDNEQLPTYYNLCNVCVIPSITYDMGDPWVFVLNEAMNFGKPVIATDAVGAAFDMINEKNGFIVPEKNVNALYNAMKKIVSDETLEKNMGKESKKIIEKRFQYENMVDGFKNAVNYSFKY